MSHGAGGRRDSVSSTQSTGGLRFAHAVSASGVRSSIQTICSTYRSGNKHDVERRIVVEFLAKLVAPSQEGRDGHAFDDRELKVISAILAHINRGYQARFTSSSLTKQLNEVAKDTSSKSFNGLIDIRENSRTKISNHPARDILRSFQWSVERHFNERKGSEDFFKLHLYGALAHFIADSDITDRSVEHFLNLMITQMGGVVPVFTQAVLAVGHGAGSSVVADSAVPSGSEGDGEEVDDDALAEVAVTEVAVTEVAVTEVAETAVARWADAIEPRMPRSLSVGTDADYQANRARYVSLRDSLVRYREKTQRLDNSVAVEAQALAALRAELEAEISQLKAEKTALARDKASLASELGRTKEILKTAESNFAVAVGKAEAFPVAVCAVEAAMERSRERQLADRTILSEKAHLKERLPFFSEVLGSLICYMKLGYFTAAPGKRQGDADHFGKAAYNKIFGSESVSQLAATYQTQMAAQFQVLKSSKEKLSSHYLYTMVREGEGTESGKIRGFLQNTFSFFKDASSRVSADDQENAAKKVALLCMLEVIKYEYDNAVKTLDICINGSVDERGFIVTNPYFNVEGVLEQHKANVQDNMNTICFCVDLFAQMYTSLKSGSCDPSWVSSSTLTDKFKAAFYKDNLDSLSHLGEGKRTFASVVLKDSENLVKFKETEFAQMFEKFKELACGPLATYLTCLEVRHPSIRDRIGEDAFWAYVAARDSSYTAPAVDEDAARGTPRHRVVSAGQSVGRSVGAGSAALYQDEFHPRGTPDSVVSGDHRSVGLNRAVSYVNGFGVSSTGASYVGAGSGERARRESYQSHKSHRTVSTAASSFGMAQFGVGRPVGGSDAALAARDTAPSASPPDGSGRHSSGSGGGASGSTSRSHGAPPSVRGNAAVATVIAPGSVKKKGTSVNQMLAYVNALCDSDDDESPTRGK